MIGVVLGLGFLLLLIALQAPLLAAVGVLTNLLATGAAFGVAKWIFQDGALHSLLGFQPQGFLDAWGPVFFFAMIFAISMDYTVFLLSSAKEHWDRTHDPKEAMVGGLAHSGRVIFAAGAVMVAVFLTFALSGPLPPKEMGIILGVAVLLDAALIRLLLLPVLLRADGPLGLVPPALGAADPPQRHLRTRIRPGTRTMSYTATAHSINGTLRHEIDVNGRHTITTDEPARLGGTDTAPTPHELLAATLASCVSTMIVLYATTQGHGSRRAPRRCRLRRRRDAETSRSHRPPPRPSHRRSGQAPREGR